MTESAYRQLRLLRAQLPSSGVFAARDRIADHRRRVADKTLSVPVAIRMLDFSKQASSTVGTLTLVPPANMIPYFGR